MTEKLLHLIDEYEGLTNGDFRTSFIEGFLQLSRANFNSGKGFGKKSYDMSEYEACKVVEGEVGKLKVRDRRGEEEAQKEEKETEKQPQKQSQRMKDTRTLNTLSSSIGIISSDTVEVKTSTFKDPIRQFGGLVPYQLRDAQHNFNKGLETCIAIINLNHSINTTIEAIETLK